MIDGWERYKDLEYYPDRVCKCGCGGRIKVKPYHSWYGIPEYINGHARRGKHHTKEAKDKCRKSKLGDKNPMYGKKQSTETKRKRLETRRNNGKPWHSEEAKEKYSITKMGEKNPAKQPEVRERIKKAMLLFHVNGGTTWMKGRVGELSPGWQGGISRLPYPFEFDEELKELIRERDRYTCQLCGKRQEENGRKLDVHHIDYLKENINLWNLITLCRGCNGKVNFNRSDWEEFFNQKMLINCRRGISDE